MTTTETISKYVREAGEIVCGAHDISKRIKEKSGTANFVTAYDVAVEDFLYEKLGKAFPEARFIGEESDENHAELLANGLSFIIDPIDGTTNFIHGFRHSAISVGLCENGKMIVGIILNPYQNELFSAERGGGAYLNGEKIHVSDRELKNSLVAFGTSPYRRELGEKTFGIVERVYFNCRDIRRAGSAALDLCYTAAGRSDLFFEANLSPWDYAAGSLIVEEAGGIITAFDRSEVTLDRPSSVIAGNKIAYEEFISKMI